MPGVAEQKTPTVAERPDTAPMHLEVGDPARIGEPGVGSDPGFDQRRKLRRGRRFQVLIVFIAIDENEPPPFGQRRNQHETAWPDNDAPAAGRAGKGEFYVCDDEAAAIGIAFEVFLHGMARHAMAAAGADEIVRPNDLLPAVFVQDYCEAVGVRFNRRRLYAEFDHQPMGCRMFAQHRLGLPLRLAALELVFAPDAREPGERDALELGAKKLDLPDTHARGEKRLDHAALVQGFEDRRLKRRSASSRDAAQPCVRRSWVSRRDEGVRSRRTVRPDPRQ